MVLDPIPQSLPVHFFGSRPQPPTSRWLRLLGSFKLLVSFAKEPYKRDDILQKRRIILRSLRIVATPYESFYQLSLISLCYRMGCRSLSYVLCRFLSWVCDIGLCYQSPKSLIRQRGGGLGSSTIFKKFNEPYAPS